MKKRLLITSIVMMLVVAVALSTATYAWFTSNANVSASSMTLKAGVNTADALGIGWLGGDAGTAITASVSGVLQPMAPVNLAATTTINKSNNAETNIAFNTKTTKQENSVIVFNSGAPDSATPLTFGNGSVSAFYVKNLSTANTVSSITVSLTFENDGTTYAFATGDYVDTAGTYFTKAGDAFVPASPTSDQYSGTLTDGKSNTYYVATTTANASLNANDMIRVAIFKKANSNGTSDVDGYTLLGVLGETKTAYTQVTENTDAQLNQTYDRNKTYYTKSGDVYTQVSIDAFAASTTYYTAANTAVYGEINPGENHPSMAVKALSNYEVAESLKLTTSLAAGNQVDIVAIAWLDGTMLNDSRQNQIGSVSLYFAAE